MSSRGSASVWLLLALLCAELSNSTRISAHVQRPVNYDMMESPGKFLNTQCVIRLIRTSYILSPLFLLWRKSFLFAFASESCLSDYNAKLTDHLYVQRWENNFIVAIYFLKKKFVAFKMQQLNNTWMMYFLLPYVVSLYPTGKSFGFKWYWAIPE